MAEAFCTSFARTGGGRQKDYGRTQRIVRTNYGPDPLGRRPTARFRRTMGIRHRTRLLLRGAGRAAPTSVRLNRRAPKPGKTQREDPAHSAAELAAVRCRTRGQPNVTIRQVSASSPQSPSVGTDAEAMLLVHPLFA